MAKLMCKCGHATKLDFDDPNGFFLLSEELIAKLEEKLDVNELTGDDMNTIIVTEAWKVSRCEACRRMYMVYGEFGERELMVYALEEVKHEGDDSKEVQANME